MCVWIISNLYMMSGNTQGQNGNADFGKVLQNALWMGEKKWSLPNLVAQFIKKEISKLSELGKGRAFIVGKQNLIKERNLKQEWYD